MKRPNSDRAARPKNSSASFLRDFLEMETAMAQGASCPVERMIVELGITPRNLKQRERAAGISFPWFAAAYRPMKRHDLLPKSKSWEAWVKEYCLAKQRALLAF